MKLTKQLKKKGILSELYQAKYPEYPHSLLVNHYSILDMKYIKVTFILTPDNEANREILTAYLSQLDFDAFDETPFEFHAFAPSGKTDLQKIMQIAAELPFKVSFSSGEMPDINWNEEWEKNYFQPLLIRNECLVRAPFHKDFPAARYEIIIEPNMAFGTGNHETTSLMIEHLLELDLTDQTVLDMGCGTGILGILASMRGCQEVTAIDVDQRAFESTTENSQLNGIRNLKAFTGDAGLLKENQKFDVILANIQKNVILNDLEKYVSVLNEEGIILVSGFYREDLEAVIGKASGLFLQKGIIKEKNRWVACSFTK
jgi:ribosomal protein L11 methyltransferase